MADPDYKSFSMWCLEEGLWNGATDLDAEDVQRAALKFGVIKQVPFDPKIHGNDCDDFMEPGDPWCVPVEQVNK